MSGLKQLIQEVHRRSLWQVLGIYVAVSWVVFQVVQTLTEGLGLPDWVPPLAFVLLLIGLPIVMATAFVQEGIPVAGRTEEASPESESVADAIEDEATAPGAGGVWRLFTWRNAILGGVLAFAFLGVVVTGYTAMRAMGIGPVGSLVAKGVIAPRERIILADFENLTSDSLLAVAVTEALRTDLSQSRVVRLAEPDYVRRVLVRMETDPDIALDSDLAREVAVREGLRAVMVGQVTQAGTAFVLSANLIAAESGEIMAGWRETARDSDGVIDAIDRLSKGIRERTGESLKSIRGSEPLARATTGSLEALLKYSQAMRALEYEGDIDKGISLLEDAVGLDSAFAMAWRKLGVALSNLSLEKARYVEALTKAYEHSDRLTERERYRTIASYHESVTGEDDKAITAYRALLDVYPEETGAVNNLSVLYWFARDYAASEDMARRALALDSAAAFHHTNLLVALVGQGKLDEAAAAIETMHRLLPGNPHGEASAGAVAYSSGDYVAAEATLRALAESQSLIWRRTANWWLAKVTAARGRIADAEAALRAAMAANLELDQPAEYLDNVAELARLDMWYRGATDRGLRRIEEALERYPLESMTPLDRPYHNLAWAYATAGKPERGMALLAEYETIDPALRRADEPWLHAARGAVQIAAGAYEEAIGEIRQWDEARVWCATCPAAELARAYDLAGEADSAIAIYERYVTTPSLQGAVADAFNRGPAYERLGALYEARGDAEKAIYYYGKLVEFWADADPELQPRVEAARRAMSALSPDQ